jgi:hypothetical protein
MRAIAGALEYVHQGLVDYLLFFFFLSFFFLLHLLNPHLPSSLFTGSAGFVDPEAATQKA